jgi:hypothetical protein
MGLLRSLMEQHITGTKDRWLAVERARALGEWDVLHKAVAQLPGVATGWLPRRPKAQLQAWEEVSRDLRD